METADASPDLSTATTEELLAELHTRFSTCAFVGRPIADDEYTLRRAWTQGRLDESRGLVLGFARFLRRLIDIEDGQQPAPDDRG